MWGSRATKVFFGTRTLGVMKRQEKRVENAIQDVKRIQSCLRSELWVKYKDESG